MNLNFDEIINDELAQMENELDYISDNELYDDEPYDDGQPTEYEEWQDFYGGDDWDHGQYDHAEYEWDCDLHNEW